jgi:hypothetical protein
MRIWILFFGVMVFGAGMVLPQTAASTAKKSTAVKKTVSRGSTTRTTASTKTSASKKGRTTKGRAAVTTPVHQLAPTPDRYREIQQALVDKGYLKSEPNGVWDTASSDALKQYQTEKNLPPTGKITSASLIGLGLGPKTAGASGMVGESETTAAAPASPPSPGGERTSSN